jgi:DNA-binding transcriptional ArsR family regulator
VDKVFRALADPTRRRLLDALFKEDGQTLSALEGRFRMTRFGVMKHLNLLEEAGLVVTKKRGREKLHFLCRSGSSTTGGSASTPNHGPER